MTLSKEFIELSTSEEVRMKIGLLSGTKFSTLSRWIKNKDEKLTQAKMLIAIEKVTGLKPNQVYKLENQLA